MKASEIEAKRRGVVRVVTRDWQRVCDETESSHIAILEIVHRLESAVLLARADAANDWREVARSEVEALIDCFEEHSSASTLPIGLIGQVESIKGHSEQVTAVLDLHHRVMGLARSLLETLIETKTVEGFSLARRGVAYLTAAAREHEAREIDLIYETSSRIMGGEG
jgi:hypothetical protein